MATASKNSGNSAWPDGMSDEEAAERLEAIVLLGCEGNQDLIHGREYKRLRSIFLSRRDLIDALPKYIRSQRDLAAFWAYIKKQAPSWAERREHVRETFGPLFDRVAGRTSPPQTVVDLDRTANAQPASNGCRVAGLRRLVGA